MSGGLTYRQAVPSDLESIVAVFQSAVAAMENSRIFQWDEFYPNREDFMEDIAKGQMYIGMGDETENAGHAGSRTQAGKNVIPVVFVLNQETDEQYVKGNWKYNTDNFLVIHRLCVNPQFQNQGIGTAAMKYIEGMAVNRGCTAIRLDVYSRNPYALKLYHGCGYTIAGEVHFRKGLFYLMEKPLQQKAFAVFQEHDTEKNSRR